MAAWEAITAKQDTGHRRGCCPTDGQDRQAEQTIAMLSGPQLNCQTKAIQTHNGQPRRPRVCHAPSQRDKSLSKIPTRERQALSEPRAQPLARRESQELAQGWAAIEPSITRAIRFSVEGLRGEVSVPGALPCSESRPNPMWWHCSSTHTHKRRTHQTVREGREKCVCRGKSRRLYPPHLPAWSHQPNS